MDPPLQRKPILAVSPFEPLRASASPAAEDRSAENENAPDPIAALSEAEQNAGRERARLLVTESTVEAERSARLDGRTRQHSMLVMVPIRSDPGQLTSLRTVLRRIQLHDVETNDLIPFLKLRTIHFARFLIHDRAEPPLGHMRTQAEVPPKLLFSTNFDGDLEEHVRDLLQVRHGLDEVFRHCEGYPEPGSADDLVLEYLRSNHIPSNTFYVGTARRSVMQIRREAYLREEIQRFLDEETRCRRLPREPLEIREHIRHWVSAHPSLAWASVQPGPFPTPLPLRAILVGALLTLGALVLYATITFGAVLLALLGALLAALAAAALVGLRHLRRLEKLDESLIRADVREHTRELTAVEDQIVQNQMSSVIWIKPGIFRRTLLRAVLLFINFSARYLNNTGRLAGIPSIHFARWVIVDDGRRLVFLSNFDGSWENYLGDFIDKTAKGLTAVWSNCVGFPHTRNLVQEGAADEQKFKSYSRDSQVPTQVWYSAYKRLSVDNINNNSKIRLGLYGQLTAAQAESWLRRF